MFRALADRTRLRILHLLKKRERCVCHIMDVLEISQPNVSRHLGYLKRAGLVLDRRQGLWRHYRLAPAKSGLHRRALACVDGCVEEMPVLRRDAAKLRALK